MTTLDTLPNDILCKNICPNLELEDLGSLSRVCKHFYTICVSFVGWKLPSNWYQLYGLSILEDRRLKDQIQELTIETPLTCYDWLFKLEYLKKLEIGRGVDDMTAKVLVAAILQLKQLEELTLYMPLSSSILIEILQSLPVLKSITCCVQTLDVVEFMEINRDLSLQRLCTSAFNNPISYHILTSCTKFLKSVTACFDYEEIIKVESDVLEELEITGNVTRLILNIPTIKKMSVHSTNIEILSDIPYLETLESNIETLSHNKLISQFPKIKALSIHGDQFTNDHMNHLDQFKQFKSLKILRIICSFNCRLIIDCPSLSTLFISVSPDDSESVYIKSCHLKELYTSCAIDIQYTDCLEILSSCSDINECGSLLHNSYPIIRSLHITNNYNLLKACISASTITRLTIMHYDNNFISYLDQFKQLKFLSLLSYSGNSISMSIHLHLPKLKMLNIDVIMTNLTIDAPLLRMISMNIISSISKINLSLPQVRYFNFYDKRERKLIFYGNFPKLHMLEVNALSTSKYKKEIIMETETGTVSILQANIPISIKSCNQRFQIASDKKKRETCAIS